MIVREATVDDAADIAEIYNHYILHTHATFETRPVDNAEVVRRLDASGLAGRPFMVALENDALTGYAYCRPFSDRPAYNSTASISVYVRPGFECRGIGSLLYDNLLPEISTRGFHTTLAVIALPNDASVRLHEKFGFERSGEFREIGLKFGKWIDVGYWQLLNSK